jgi:hypothetical protein
MAKRQRSALSFSTQTVKSHLKRSYERGFEAEIELVWIHDVYLLNGGEDGLLAGRYK